MFDFIFHQNVWTIVLIGLGIAGVMARLILFGFLKGMNKAAENMGTTRKKTLSEFRKRYQELTSLNMDIGNTDAFVSKYINRLTLWKMNLYSWRGFANNVLLATAGVSIIGGYVIYNTSGSFVEPIQTAMLGFGICIVQLMAANLFDSGTRLRILKCTIENYLENSLANRLKREAVRFADTAETAVVNIETVSEAAASEEREPRKAGIRTVSEEKGSSNARIRAVTDERGDRRKQYKEKGERDKEKKKRRAEPAMGDSTITKEQIAACDALFDKLMEGITT